MSTQDVLGFGVFELDVKTGELRKQGRKVRLADQPFQVLRRLVERPGDIVAREELQQALWSQDTFVDFDTGLSSAVRKLRDALGDSADNPQFIETIPKRGYRFIAPVVARNGNGNGRVNHDRAEGSGLMAPQRPIGAEPSDIALSPQPSALTPVTAKPQAARPSRLVWIAAAIALAAVVAAALYVRSTRESAAAPSALTSLAVLPFENLTGDEGQRYVVDGFTDGLMTTLVQNERLQVTSRGSSMRYRSTQKSAPQIGKELGVSALVLGSVVRAGDRLRITAQLVDTATDRHIWAHSYDGTIDEMMALQDQIAATIVQTLGVDARTIAAQSLARRPIDREAYIQYLRGVNFEGRGGNDGFRHAIESFEAAVARQPDFALAWAALGRTQQQLLYTSALPPREIVPKAEAAVRKAIALDDTLAAPHTTLGSILHDYYWRWPEGDRENQRARALEPNTPGAHMAAANHLIRAGKYDEALIETERARQLDPLNQNMAVTIAAMFRGGGQYDRAIDGLRKAIAVDPKTARPHFQLGATLLQMGKTDEAIAEIETATTRTPGNARFEAYLACAYARRGRRADAERILGELEARGRTEYVSSFGIALIYDALGNKQAALAAINRAFEERAVEFAQMKTYPPFETLRGEPRFEEIIRAVSRH